MINAIIEGIFNLVISLVNLLLTPIDLLINNYLPSLSYAFQYINDFFDFIGNIVPFVLSYTGIKPILLNIIIDIFIFILTVPLLIHTSKLAIRWYSRLKG